MWPSMWDWLSGISICRRWTRRWARGQRARRARVRARGSAIGERSYRTGQMSAPLLASLIAQPANDKTYVCRQHRHYLQQTYNNNKNLLMRPMVLLLSLLLLLVSPSLQLCHYTCLSCSGPEYHHCLTCPPHRGTLSANQPIAGMCYCSDDSDQNNDGVCTQDRQFNRNNKTVIAVFIGLSLLIGLVSALVTGFRYFLVKVIEDVQQISIIVFINLYFPQQFDIFLTYLYRFNISSFAFESLSMGSLFKVDSNNIFSSTDGQNIFGKYQLMGKSANFFANQFTWTIVFVSLLAVAVVLKVVRGCLKACNDQHKEGQPAVETTMANEGFKEENLEGHVEDERQPDRTQKQPKSLCLYPYINKLYNFTWFNFFLIFFYLSLIEININVFTQISNLTFSSGFAAAGTFFSALFLALECVLLALLALKTRQQTIKPEWMRDYAYSTPIYLIRTNYKTLTKYFWFFSCIKKILLGLIIATLYSSPSQAILGISSIQIAYICISVYCQPYQRRYLRIYFYITEGMKLFIFVCMINFTEQYVEYARMIELTKILYTMLAVYFGIGFGYIVLNVVAERGVYARVFLARFCPGVESKWREGRMGYHCEGKLYLYERE